MNDEQSIQRSVSALLTAERDAIKTGDDAMKARVLARARGTLGLEPPPSDAASSPSQPSQAVPVALGKASWIVDVLLVAACVAGTVVSRPVLPAARATPMVAIDAPRVAPPEIPPSSVVEIDVHALPSVAAAKAHVRPPAAPAPRPTDAPSDSDEASERTVIAAMRAGLNRGDYAAAAKALEEHKRRFPQGQLVEQRKALEIWLIAERGDRTRARERAAQFRSEHPGSVMQRALDSSEP